MKNDFYLNKLLIKIKKIENHIQILNNPNSQAIDYENILSDWCAFPYHKQIIDALCDKQRPFRYEVNIPRIQKNSLKEPFYHLIPEGTACENSHEIPIKPGQFYFSIEALKFCCDDPQCRLVILNGGHGFRTGLLGLSAGSKGKIRLFGKTLSEHIANSFYNLLNEIGSDYIIFSASDDLIEINPSDISRIKKYLNKYSFFFFDLPDAGKNIYPFNEKTRKKYIFSKLFRESFSTLFPDIPKQILKKIIFFLYYSKNNKTIIDVFSCNTQSRIWLFLLSYISHHQMGGIITPFVFIFSKKKIINVLQRISQCFSDSLKPILGWHDFLLYGFKMDRKRWSMYKSFKTNNKIWNNLYCLIKKFMKTFSIRLEDSHQNKLRVFKNRWYSFNFVENFMTYLELSGKKEIRYAYDINNSVRQYKITIFSDGDNIDPFKVTAFKDSRIFLQNSQVQGYLNIIFEPGTPENEFYNDLFFYNITLDKNKGIQVYSGHCYVVIKQKIYSMKIFSLSKEHLGNSFVYEYFYDNFKNCFFPRSYMKFINFYKNIWNINFASTEKS